MAEERVEAKDTQGMSDFPMEPTSEDVGNGEYSTLFLKLREQSIIQVMEMMDSTVASMHRLERTMERINASTTGVGSVARIWSSFYDPTIVEKLKKDSVGRNNDNNDDLDSN